MKAPNLPTSTRGSKPDPEQVAIAAYDLYMKRGGVDGHDLEDWLHAEKLLSRQLMESAEQKTSAPTTPLKGKFNGRAKDRDYPLARDERGSASREEVRRQSTPSRPAARHSSS